MSEACTIRQNWQYVLVLNEIYSQQQQKTVKRKSWKWVHSMLKLLTNEQVKHPGSTTITDCSQPLVLRGRTNAFVIKLQIDLVCQSVSRKLTLMKLLSKYVNQKFLKQYYNSYVLPVFDFKCVVWGNTTADLTRLVKLQKRAARMILKADFMTPSEQLFKELNWLPFPKRAQYHTCLTVYKSINEQAPE